MAEPKRITKQCNHCGKAFSIPQCRDWRENSCSSECKIAARETRKEALRAERTRSCAHCQKDFIIKKSQIDAGQGKHCSHKCATAAGMHAALMAPEAQARARLAYAALSAAGKIHRPTGENHPRWQGGKEATYERHREAILKRNKLYRKANPEKVREWSQKRLERKTGRLPRGTVSRLLVLQKRRCACCSKKLVAYHVDHVMPLARGGEHSKENIQLLCPSCNVRKSAKDPIQFMQERGFLL